MADNISVTPGTGATIAADDVGGTLYQEIKKVRGKNGKRAGDVQYGVINCSSAGDNTILSADVSNHIRVLHYTIIAAAAVNATWKSGAGTSLSGPLPLDAKGGACPSFDDGLFETAVNAALVLNLGSAVQVSGHFSYVLEA